MKRQHKSMAFVIALIMIFCMLPMSALAANEKTEVIGKFYEYDKDSHYEFHEGGTSEQTTKDNTYGTFYISGNVTMEENKHNLPEENFPQPEEMLPEEQPVITELTMQQLPPEPQE